MYRIDVPTYHWDNDYFRIETKVLHFEDLVPAGKYQKWLRSRQFENDSLLCNPSFNPFARNGKTCDIPHRNALAWTPEYSKIGVHHGAIIESPFDIYTERVIRTKIGT